MFEKESQEKEEFRWFRWPESLPGALLVAGWVKNRTQLNLGRIWCKLWVVGPGGMEKFFSRSALKIGDFADFSQK